MKNVTTILGLVLMSSTVLAGTAADSYKGRTPAEKLKLVKQMAADQVKSDIRTSIKMVKEGICGADGPSYIVEVQLKKTVKSYDEGSGEIKLSSKWETIKAYGASSNELGRPITPGLMDSENCME